MDKYQEAINSLENICGDNLYNAGVPKPVKEIYEEEYNNIKQFIENREKYKWHNLIKNSGDLPKESKYVFICYNGKIEYTDYDICYYNHDDNSFKVEEFGEDKETCQVLAWKEIETFIEDFLTIKLNKVIKKVEDKEDE